MEGNSEGEVKACEWYEVEPDGCEERLEAQVCEASTLVQIVPFTPAEVDVVRLSIIELSRELFFLILLQLRFLLCLSQSFEASSHISINVISSFVA